MSRLRGVGDGARRWLSASSPEVVVDQAPDLVCLVDLVGPAVVDRALGWAAERRRLHCSTVSFVLHVAHQALVVGPLCDGDERAVRR